MLNDASPNFAPKANSQETPVSRSRLNQWVSQFLEQSQYQVKVRLRGNHLHVLCESSTQPDARIILSKLKAALATTSLESILPPDASPIHRMIIYGRIIGQKDPVWTRAITLPWSQPSTILSPTSITEAENPQTRAEKGVEEPVLLEQATVNQAADSPNRLDESLTDTSTIESAKQGDAGAIARYLSDAVNSFNAAIRVKIDAAPGNDLKRLLVVCESAYTPDPSLLADPITQCLRELDLQQFRDAVVFGQVAGEPRPEWMVRVDLTPPTEILKEWGRWGDIQAIAQLLNTLLEPQQVTISALLKDFTLHLSCTGNTREAPDKLSVLERVTPVLQDLAPQGIQSVAIYGVVSTPATPNLVEGTPAWVSWLDLSSDQPDRALNTLTLAQQGNLPALTFLLTRLLNPDVNATLATAGIRVQIRQKGDLLHILTDSPNCPRQDAVVPAIVRFIKPLQIPSVAGLRLYGRRAGQKQPLWHYGVDFVSRNRIAPEATPEFMASATHVDELLSPSGAIVLWSELPEDDWDSTLKDLYHRAIEGVQRSLIRTQLFVPTEGPALNASLIPVNATQTGSQRQKIALLWGFLGALLVLQADWLLGYWIRVAEQPIRTTVQTPAPVNDPPPQSLTAQIPEESLQKNRSQRGNGFNTSAFTQAGQKIITPAQPSSETPPDVTLPASPLQAKAETVIGSAELLNFNSRQLNGQIALYRRYLEIHGAPDVLIVGSSRALRGVDPAALRTALAAQGYSGVKVFNFGINGATAQVVDLLVRQILPQDKRPKLIIFADGARAFNSGRLDITYNGITASEGYQDMLVGNLPFPSTVAAQLPTQPDTSVNEPSTSGTNAAAGLANRYQQLNESLNERLAVISMIYSKRDRLKTELRRHFASTLQQVTQSTDVAATSDQLLNASSPAASAANGTTITADEQTIDIEGFLPLSIRFNPTTYYQRYARVSGDYDSDYDSFNLEGTQTDALLALAQYAQTNQIPLVFVNLPLTQDYLDPVRKRHEQTFQQQMLRATPQFGVIYRDLTNALVAHPHYFSDPSHLNRYGAYEVSRRLAQDILIPWQVTR